MISGEGFELGDDISMSAELEVRVDPFAEDDEPELFEPSNLCLREVVEREVRERRPSPERKRARQPVAPLRSGQAPCIRQLLLERARVDVHAFGTKEISRRPRLEDVGAECSP